MKKIIGASLVLMMAIFITGCNRQAKTEKTTDTAEPVVEQQEKTVVKEVVTENKAFTNADGKYSFDIPASWNAVVNQYNSKNSLFGVNATSSSGLGGVEISNFAGTLNELLDSMEQEIDVKFLTRENITINGVSGIKTQHKSSSANGYSVLLKSGNQVFNIYINSKDKNDLELFNKLVASFKLLSAN